MNNRSKGSIDFVKGTRSFTAYYTHFLKGILATMQTGGNA